MRTTPATALLVAALSCPGFASAEDADLYAAAIREGSVTWYSVILTDEAAGPLARAFEAKYPGVRVDYTRGNTEINARKIIDEAKAGKPVGDVFDGSTTVVPLLAAGLVEGWKPPSAAAIPDRYRDPEGRWSAVLLEFLTVGYNADMVGPADAPQTLEDLLDPKWRGKMIWSGAGELTGGAGFVANVLMDRGEAAGTEYLTKLKQQDITSHNGDGHAVIGELVARKFPVGLQLFNHHTFIERSKGNDIRWLKIEPVLGFSNNIGLVRGSPHPNAGRLLIAFILSPQGQTIIRDGRHIPASSLVEALDPTLKTGFRVNYVSPPFATQHMAEWTAAYSRIFK